MFIVVYLIEMEFIKHEQNRQQMHLVFLEAQVGPADQGLLGSLSVVPPLAQLSVKKQRRHCDGMGGNN